MKNVFKVQIVREYIYICNMMGTKNNNKITISDEKKNSESKLYFILDLFCSNMHWTVFLRSTHSTIVKEISTGHIVSL